MKTLLRIDASIRLTGSITRSLTDYFEEAWLHTHPDAKVIRRCLVSEPIPHLSQAAFEAFQSPGGSADASALSDKLISEIKQADHLLIGSPLYNFGLPSSIKAYFDQVVRSGATFEVEQGNYQGLLTGKCATLITARGSHSSTDYIDDFQTDYIKQILGFIGITSVETVAVEGVAGDQRGVEKALVRAKKEIDWLCKPNEFPAWLGEFSSQDKYDISLLRERQAEAIISGDVDAYQALCADDIQLLIPNRDVISGKSEFLQTEEALFRSSKFVSFRKTPIRVERSGELAVEVGCQEVRMQNKEQSGGVFSARQKYTHMFRLTDQGWRFALLMSNPSE
ncbi:NAD(P)H-dependent oxidoreductase [Sedimenticola sp.]|uniref:NAD(P)H-dependent oxidoreductase n=1 Tax=Sedimenticola sp. TaxID=1940285 RepID=UPI003D15259A